MSIRRWCLEKGYLLIRGCVTKGISWYQKIKSKPQDLEPAIHIGDGLIQSLYKTKFHNLLFKFDLPKITPVEVYDLSFPSPLTFAAFKDDITVLRMWLDLGIGGGCLKTILKEPRMGNQRPRIVEATIQNQPCLINAMGLPGKGVNGLLKAYHASNFSELAQPIGFSIGGHDAHEYVEVLEILESQLTQSHKAYYEVNISCPNTKEGQELIKNPDIFERMLRELRAKTNRVIAVKLSPDQSNHSLLVFAELTKSVSKTMLNLGNTTTKFTSFLSTGKGGLSGGVLFERTLEMAKLVHGLGLPVISTGGIHKPWHLRALKESGTTLFGLATILVQNPYIIPQFNGLFIDL